LSDIDTLIKEAEYYEKDSLILELIANKAEYNYFLNTDFEQMLESASILKERAKQYNNHLYEAKAHKYIAQAYSLNELYNKSLENLEIGLTILDESKSDNILIIMEQANFHTAFANVYNLKGEYFSSIQCLLSSVNIHQKLTDPEWKRGATFMDYSNLGGAYLNVNLDSAKVYAERSITLMTEKEETHDLTYLNYIVLGRVSLERADYGKALEYYKMAEKIQDNKHFLNTKDLYKKMSQVYKKLDSTELAMIYKNKLTELEFEISQSQNKFLRKIIHDNQPVDSQHINWMYIVLSLVLVGLSFTILFQRYILNRKKKNVQNSLTPEKYNQLIQLIRNNDPSFLLAFEKEFPNFTQKLQTKSPELTLQEIELLAKIRLNLSNKEIAQFKFLQHKTVQNNRYMIRKKLNLPAKTDLNKWVGNI